VKLRSYAPSEASAALEQHFRSRRNPFTNTLLTMSNTNKMRGFGLKMIAGVAIAGTVTLAMGTSAQAAVIGRFDFAGNADLNTTSIDFATFATPLGTMVPTPGPGEFAVTGTLPTFFSGLSSLPVPSIGNIKDLMAFGSTAPGVLGTPIDDFISFASNPALNFKLTEFYKDPLSSTVYQFKGVFGNGTLGQGKIGTFDANGISNNLAVRAYAGSLEAVDIPSPALLPGLLGIGMAAMRKRQSKTATA
jgi:hypothetical protein